MIINRKSDAIITIKLTDNAGEKFRVADCSLFILHLYTTDPEVYVECTYIDGVLTNILEGEEYDQAIVKSDLLDELDSGVIAYNYNFRMLNDNFPDGYYDEVQEGYTNFYLK